MKRPVYKTFINFSFWSTLILSSAVILGWSFDIKGILSILDFAPTMKFNTAFSFILCSIVLKTSQYKSKKSKLIELGAILVIILLSSISIIEDFFPLPIEIDNLFIYDVYSDEKPGRMSLATAINFLIVGISMLFIKSKKKSTILLGQRLLFIVSALSSISIIAYILTIPVPNKPDFIRTMAIHTSVLFSFISISLILLRPKVGIANFLIISSDGSRLFRILLPLLFILPIILGYIFIYAIEAKVIDVSFGIIIYSVIFLFFAVSYIAIVAKGLNKTDNERKSLANNLTTKHKELLQFKLGLDQVAIVSISDKKGALKYINDNFLKTSGYRYDELIGKKFYSIHSRIHSDIFNQKIWDFISSGKVWTGDIKSNSKGGKAYWESTAIVPLMDHNNNIREYLFIKQDITKRKEAEELLSSKYVKQLEKNNRELEEFAFVASHDLQEPLKTISSFSDLLYDDYFEKLDDNAKMSFSFIKQSTDRMSNLIKSLLEYSRLGKEFKKESINTKLLVSDIVNDLNATIANKNASVNIEELPIIEGYSIPLQLLFQNLISNALKFQLKGRKPEITISARDMADFWEFAVKDNGIGIEEKHLENIFVIFQRLHLESEFEGTGIGLSHCKRVAEMHNGTIEVKSVLGKGSTFLIKLNKNI